MGQYWMIADIDKQEAISTAKLGETIYRGIGSELYSQLREAKWNSVKEIMNNFGVPKKKATPHSLGYLELPKEIIDMIFSNIEDPWTAFRFGCANTQLLVIGEKHIHQLMGPPNWRGDRIICVGDYCDEDDIPEGLDLGDDYEEFYDSADDGENVGPYGWACTFQEPDSRHNLSACFEWPWEIPFGPIGYRLSEPIYEAREPTVLWNLSKQVYFRRESIPTELPKAAERFDSDDVMGTTLLLQICWSSDDSLSLAYGRKSDDVKLSRGKWAGDRFELTGDDVLQSRLREEGSKWEDVSEEVIKLFVDVFKAERG